MKPAPATIAAKPVAAPLHWCASCSEYVEPYTMTREDACDRGAVGFIFDAGSGITMFRMPYGGPLVATDTPLCSGCDSVLAVEAARAAMGDA